MYKKKGLFKGLFYIVKTTKLYICYYNYTVSLLKKKIIIDKE